MHRSSTLDYDAVPASLAGAAVKPGDPAYGRLASTYFRGGAPGIMLLPRTVEQVADAVGFAGHHLHVPLGIRSGGHGLSGRSTNDGGIVIDLRHLNGIHVLDPSARLFASAPAPAGGTSPPRYSRTAGRCRPATVARWVWAAWRPPAGSGCSPARTA